jgi:hypothetical protein
MTAPIRTLCAWCLAVLVDVEEDQRGVSHGICHSCAKSWRKSA